VVNQVTSYNIVLESNVIIFDMDNRDICDKNTVTILRLLMHFITRKCVPVILLIGLMLYPHEISASNAQTYNKPSQIPSVLRKPLSGNVTKDQFMKRVTHMFNTSSTNKQELTRDDIERTYLQEIHLRRISQRNSYLRHDVNFDASLSLDELSYWLYVGRMETNTEQKKRIEDTMAHDTNGDGVLSYKEVSTLLPDELDYVSYYIKESNAYKLFMLDPNRDGALTIDELTSVAMKSFRTLDRNHDLTISRDEYGLIWKKDGYSKGKGIKLQSGEVVTKEYYKALNGPKKRAVLTPMR